MRSVSEPPKRKRKRTVSKNDNDLTQVGQIPIYQLEPKHHILTTLVAEGKIQGREYRIQYLTSGGGVLLDFEGGERYLVAIRDLIQWVEEKGEQND